MPTKLAFTCGDPAGIGPEIIASWLAEHPAESAEVVVIGPKSWLSTLPANVARKAVGDDAYRATPGKPTPEGASIALEAMEEAARGCQMGAYNGVVTGPVSKAELANVGFQHPGQTEFFADYWGGEPTMAFSGGKLRVALATWHIPLRDVANLLSSDSIERAVMAAYDLCKAEEVVDPRIGVCGLNPHAGERGLLGSEEEDWINPALSRLQDTVKHLSLCEPADTLFRRAYQGEFDAVVALYHDQGLAPLKLLEFDEAVNVTLGLPFVRTSPDHGTAFSLAGKGKASTRSFANAVVLAQRLIRRRG